MPHYQAMFVTDLDGTLLGPDHTYASGDLEALERLRRMGVLVAVATGRSLHSFARVNSPSLPLDYLIFSTGSGVLELQSNRIIKSHALRPDQTLQGMQALKQARVDFTVHRPIPENHFFSYFTTDNPCRDFLDYIERNQEFARPRLSIEGFARQACQMLAIVPKERGMGLYGVLKKQLSGLSVVLATSPVDGYSAWIEVFSPKVNKARAAAWLANQFGLGPGQTGAVGNDYNDRDLLEWAGWSYVVGNAPGELQTEFEMVSPNGKGGVAQAARMFKEGYLRR